MFFKSTLDNFQSPTLSQNKLRYILKRRFFFVNRPFAASHSRGTKPPCWRAKVALGQDEKRKLPFKIMCFLFVMCDFCSLARRFVPREWLAAKRLFP